jgi:hypothetical protein
MLWVEGNFQGDYRVQAIVRSAETIRDAARHLNVSIITVRRYMRDAQSPYARMTCYIYPS